MANNIIKSEVKEYKLKDLGIEHLIIPKQPSQPKDIQKTEFKINKKDYSKNAYSTDKIATVEVLGIMRGERIARLNISPVKYNPVTNSIKVYSNITVELSFENADILRKKEAEIALMQNNVVLWAYFGTHMFEDKPNKNFRLLQPFVPNAYHFMVDKNINSLLDIKGKRFVVGRAGSGALTVSEAVLAAIGLSFDDFRPEYLGQQEGLNALRNGVVDVVLAMGGYPVPSISDMMGSLVFLVTINFWSWEKKITTRLIV